MLDYLMQVVEPNAAMVRNVVDPLVAVSVMLTLLVLAVIYMASQFFRRPEQESFVSIELHQLLVSVLIYITIFGAVVFASNMSEQFAHGDPFTIARTYLNFIVNQVAVRAVEELYALLLLSQYMGSLTMRWGPSAWGAVMLTNPSFIVIERTVDFLLLLISPFTSSLMVQMAMLEAMRAIAIPFLLPAGVILRLFPPTRDASAILLAASIGFGLVFPFTYVMHNDIVVKMLDTKMGGWAAQNNPELYLKSNNYGSLATYINDNGSFNAWEKLWHPVVLMSFLLLQALFLPALSITITIAFIKSFSKFIGQKLG